VSVEVRVDPSVLDRAASACDGLRVELTSDEADVEPATTGAMSGLAGWGIRGALDQVLWWWRDDLTKLGGYLDGYGDALRGCARDYRVTDRADSGRFLYLKR
jgi:hypothetical protein